VQDNATTFATNEAYETRKMDHPVRLLD